MGIPEAAHRVVALFDAAVILLDPVVQLPVAAMGNLLTQHFTDRPWIGIMAVGREPLGWLPSDSQRCREETFGRLHIAVLTEQRVNEVAIAVNRAVKVLPLPADTDVRFVDMPRSPSLSLPFGTQFVCDERGEALFPLADSLMGKGKPALEEHLCKVPQAQLVAQAPEHDEQNNISGNLQIVKWGAGAFVELTPASGTPKCLITELSSRNTTLWSWQNSADRSCGTPDKLDSELIRIPRNRSESTVKLSPDVFRLVRDQLVSIFFKVAVVDWADCGKNVMRINHDTLFKTISGYKAG